MTTVATNMVRHGPQMVSTPRSMATCFKFNFQQFPDNFAVPSESLWWPLFLKKRRLVCQSGKLVTTLIVLPKDGDGATRLYLDDHSVAVEKRGPKRIQTLKRHASPHFPDTTHLFIVKHVHLARVTLSSKMPYWQLPLHLLTLLFLR